MTKDTILIGHGSILQFMKKLLKTWGPSMIIVMCAIVQIVIGLFNQEYKSLVLDGLFVASLLIFTVPIGMTIE